MPAAQPARPKDAIKPPDGEPGSMERPQGAKPDEPPPHEPDPNELHWIEILLVDEADEPVAVEPFEIELPNGRRARGTTNKEGLARIEGIPAGTCRICFTRLDQDAWMER